MSGIPQEPNSYSDNRSARLPGNIQNAGRLFANQVYDRVVVDSHQPNVQEQIVRSATPTRAARTQMAFTLAQWWWARSTEPTPAIGRATFGWRNARAALPSGRTTEPVTVRMNIARPASVTTAEAMFNAPIAGLESDWV
jgi:hypothetical protein